MRLAIRTVSAAVAACGAAVLLAGCARPGPLGAGASGAPSPADWTTFAAEVTGVRPGPAPQALVIDVSLPAGAEGCARNPRTDMYTEENNTIYANVVVDSARAGVHGGCPGAAAAVVMLTAPGPIGDRVVVLNQQAWARTGDAYRRCAADIGCHPPADHCDPSWQLAAFNGLDVPRHAARDVEHCDQQWMVMVVDLNTAQCGAGGRPGCSAPPSVHRYFLRFRDGAWQDFAQTQAGGCDAVRRADPAFPDELCRTLPPVR